MRDKYDLNGISTFSIISGEVGCSKPDPKIFEILVNELHAEPSQCIFIDDRLRNIQSAAKYGLNPILFNRNKEFIEELVNVKQVQSFEELRTMLGEQSM